MLIALTAAASRPTPSPVKVDAPAKRATVVSTQGTPKAEVILWLEDFEGGFPGSMTAYKLGAQDSPGWREFTSSSSWASFGGGPMGTVSAGHNDDEVSSGSCDDWFVSPAIELPNSGNPIYLTFYHGTKYAPDWTEYRGVWVSTGSGDPADSEFVELADLSDSSSNDAWTELSFDLSAYAGQTVYIAFRYVGNWADEWFLDSVAVWLTTFDNDLAVELVSPVNSVTVGESFAPQVRLKNVGTNDASGVNVYLSISDWHDNVVYSETQTVDSLASGDSVDLSFPATSFSAPGPYTFLVFHDYSADENNANDTVEAVVGAVRYIYTVYRASGSITVDGVIDSAEWAGVEPLDISDFLGITDSPDTPGTALLLAAHNLDTLFLAYVVYPDDAQDQYDQVSLALDDNNDGSWPAAPDTTEGVLAVLPDSWAYAWIQDDYSWSGWQPLSSPPPSAFSYSEGYLVAEVAIPIVHDAAEDLGPWVLYSTVSSEQDDTVGVFAYYIDSASYYYAWWPQSVPGSEWYVPSYYGDFVLSHQLSVASDKGEPEFASLRVLGLKNPSLVLQLPSSERVRVEVYDASGRAVKLLSDGRLEAGVHRFSLAGLKPGVYAALVKVGAKTLKAKFVMR